MFNGADGGAGTFAIQIARTFGTDVTAVGGSETLDMLSSLGAEHVIDYTKEDFTKTGRRYDLIIDVKSYRSVFDYRRALSPGGICVSLGGSMPRIFLNVPVGSLFSMIGGKKVRVLLHKPNQDMSFLNELFESGKVVPVIDKTYPLSEVPETLRRFGEGRQIGKIVITV